MKNLLLQNFIYTVEEGEKIVDIALKFMVSPYKIIKENGLKREVKVGQKIIISLPEKSFLLLPDSENLSKEFFDSLDKSNAIFPFLVVEELKEKDKN